MPKTFAQYCIYRRYLSFIQFFKLRFSSPFFKEPDSPADYPKIEFKYHVEFTFMRDSQSEESLEDTSVIDRIKDNSFSKEEDPSLQSVSTDELLWANTIQLNFKKPFVIKELTRMRDFLQNGVTFIVIGVQHTYVLEDPQLADDVTTPRSMLHFSC